MKTVTIKQGRKAILGVDLQEATNPLTYLNPLNVMRMGATLMANGARAMITGEVPIENDITVSGASRGEVDDWMGMDRKGRGMSGTPLNYAPGFTSTTRPDRVQRGQELDAGGLLPKFVPSAFRGAVGSEVTIREERAPDGNLEADFQLRGRVANGRFDFEVDPQAQRRTNVNERGVVRPLPSVPSVFNPGKAALGALMGAIHLQTVEAENAVRRGAQQSGYRVIKRG